MPKKHRHYPRIGPRIPLRFGTGPTETCRCGAWRLVLHVRGRWRKDITIEQAQEEHEEL